MRASALSLAIRSRAVGCHGGLLRISVNFFRPLPSLLHQIDYRLYGLNVQGWRVTTLALWLLLLWAVALLQGLITPIPPEIGPLFGLWSIALPAQLVALLVSMALLPRLQRDPVFAS